MTRRPQTILVVFLTLSVILGHITSSETIKFYNKLVIEVIGFAMLFLFGILATFPIDKSKATKS